MAPLGLSTFSLDGFNHIMIKGRWPNPKYFFSATFWKKVHIFSLYPCEILDLGEAMGEKVVKYFIQNGILLLP